MTKARSLVLLALGLSAGLWLMHRPPSLRPASEEVFDPRYPDLIQEPWETAIGRKLSVIVRVRFDGTPFRQAIAELERLGGITINLARDVRDEALDARPVRFDSLPEGMTLQGAVDRLCGEAGLAWTPLRDGTLLADAPSRSWEPSVPRRYVIRDLLTCCAEPGAFKRLLIEHGWCSGPPDIERHTTGEALIAFIHEHCDPDIWSSAGNGVEYWEGRLFISAPVGTQRKIQQALKQMREEGWRPPSP